MEVRFEHTALLIMTLSILAASCSIPGPATVATPAMNTVTAQPASTPDLGDLQVRSRDGMVMVYVPAGQFEMGSSDALDAFWVDRTEVTNAHFAAFLNEQGNQSEEVTDAQFAEWLIGHSNYSSIYTQVEGQVFWLEPGQYGLIDQVDGEFQPRNGYASHPVIEVSWYGAAAYCNWVGGRLPTEAEWEYAARGPEGRVYPWGDTFDGSLTNFCDASCLQEWRNTAYDDGHAQWAPVGSYPGGASWCGALDMAGNIWEWVNDQYDQEYYASSPADDPQGPNSGSLRVRRGGSWSDEEWMMRSAYRCAEFPSSLRVHWVGFRCVAPVWP